MSNEILALGLGTVLAVGALAYVLYPLFFGAMQRPVPPVTSGAGEEGAIRALREIEFDRATGKLSEADYQALRDTHVRQALTGLRAESAEPAPVTVAANAVSLDIEERVRAYRASRRECPTCGLRPEPDAIYCSSCGAELARAQPE